MSKFYLDLSRPNSEYFEANMILICTNSILSKKTAQNKKNQTIFENLTIGSLCFANFQNFPLFNKSFNAVSISGNEVFVIVVIKVTNPCKQAAVILWNFALISSGEATL